MPPRASINSNTQHIIIARLDPTGVPQWTQVIGHDSVNIIGKLATARPVSGASGPTDVYFGGSYSSWHRPLTIGNVQLPSPLSRERSFVMALYNSFFTALDGNTGNFKWALGDGNGPGRSFIVSSVSVNPSGEIAFSGRSDSFTDLLRFGAVVVPFPSVSYYYTATGKILQAYNTITGTVFADTNTNGQPDPGETTFRNLLLEIQPGGHFVTTGNDGKYAAITPLGQHSLTMPRVPRYYTLTAAPAPVAFTTFGNLAAGRHFIVQPIVNQPDLRVNLTPISWARPGGTLCYRVDYANIGTTPFGSGSGTITLQLDSLLHYQSTTGGGTINGATLTTPYTNLLPQGSGSFKVCCRIDTSANLNSMIRSTATINPVVGDLTPLDNTETSTTFVRGSFDPNDIRVNWERLTPAQVNAGEWLDYTIRFENLGTDTAFSVRVRDSLPADQLDLRSLEFVATSHPATWSLGAGNVLGVRFTSIRLPQRAVDSVNSQGFVRFRVRPRPTLALGAVIANKAAIYFDYNVPVITNTALTEVTTAPTPTGRPGDRAELAGGVWPNPTRDALTVEVRLPAAGALHLTLLDAVGRTVVRRDLSAPAGPVRERLDVTALPAGLYLLRAQAGSHRFTRRVVIK